MRKTKQSKAHNSESDELRLEYELDYGKAKPNRFAAQLTSGGRMVVLEPDVAKAFETREQVNSALRALIPGLPAPQSER